MFCKEVFMPPKVKFAKEEILAAALDLTREEGISAVTARALGAKLGVSSRPIFGWFESMAQVHSAVLKEADRLYQEYLQKEMAGGEYPPYKASGIAYIRFAREEKELFKLLFMRDRSEESHEENREAVKPLLSLICQSTGLSEEEAYLFHLESWVFVHGIATMIATTYLEWDWPFISRMLTDCYEGLRLRYQVRGREEL